MARGRKPTIDVAEAVRLYQLGLSGKAVAVRMGVTAEAVYYQLRRLKVARRPGKVRKLPEADCLRRLYVDERRTLKEIASMYHCTWEVVRAAIRRIGIKARRSGPRTVDVCIMVGCTKPVHRTFHRGFNSWYGRRCRFHRRLHYASLNRWLTRKYRQIPPEKWYWRNEVPEEIRNTEKYQAFLREEGEKEALRHARLALRQVQQWLKENDNAPRH